MGFKVFVPFSAQKVSVNFRKSRGIFASHIRQVVRPNCPPHQSGSCGHTRQEKGRIWTKYCPVIASSFNNWQKQHLFASLRELRSSGPTSPFPFPFATMLPHVISMFKYFHFADILLLFFFHFKKCSFSPFSISKTLICRLICSDRQLDSGANSSDSPGARLYLEQNLIFGTLSLDPRPITYLIYVTDTTDGVCVKKIARCKSLQI